MDRTDYHYRIQDLEATIEALKMEYYIEKHREYDDNAGMCFENRRSLARRIAKFLGASEEDTEAMVQYSHDAPSPEGGYVVRFYLNILRERIKTLTAEKV